ncbi:MAG: Crp/Fnr family transcriptional regulator [Gemmatimonas sp.]|nr:Crp/Fnr family transcriptional regulator [Gemmatimonas sp.]
MTCAPDAAKFATVREFGDRRTGAVPPAWKGGTRRGAGDPPGSRRHRTPFRAGQAPVPSRRLVPSIANFLATIPLFESLDAAERSRFAELVREKNYPKGSVILFEDDPGDALFVVRTGRVKVVLLADDGREVILSLLGVGEYFGELALIDDQPRSAHVIAMEESALLVLRRDDFRRRVESSPGVAWALLQELSRRLRRADEKIGSLVLLDVPGRIARMLLDAAEDGGADLIDKPLTHQTIAQVIGASRETVSRAMREFQDHKWLSTERRRIRLLDKAALRERAQQRV